MLSADEAMLGSIPDREAPLPYIPKAGPCDSFLIVDNYHAFEGMQ